MAFYESFNGLAFIDDSRHLPKPSRMHNKPFYCEATPINHYRYEKGRTNLPRPDGVKNYLRTPDMVSAYDRRYNNVPQPMNPYHGGQERYSMGTLPQMVGGLGDIGTLEKSFFKKVAQAVKKVVKEKPLQRILLAPVTAGASLVAKKETVGRWARRAGGVVTGMISGAPGGVVGMVAGGATGGLMAKKGTRGIKGYGKIALASAAVGATAGAVTGAAAQAGYATGLLSQGTAQGAILASGTTGMFGMSVAAGAPVLPSIGSALSLTSTAKSLLPQSKVQPNPSGPEDLMSAPPVASIPAPNNYGLDIPGFSPASAVPSSYSEQGEPQWRASLPEPPSSMVSSEGAIMRQGEAATAAERPAVQEASVFGGFKKEHLLLLGGVGILAIALSSRR